MRSLIWIEPQVDSNANEWYQLIWDSGIYEPIDAMWCGRLTYQPFSAPKKVNHSCPSIGPLHSLIHLTNARPKKGEEGQTLEHGIIMIFVLHNMPLTKKTRKSFKQFYGDIRQRSKPVYLCTGVEHVRLTFNCKQTKNKNSHHFLFVVWSSGSSPLNVVKVEIIKYHYEIAMILPSTRS